MALFENIFGTQPDRGRYKPKDFKPRPFRKPGRLERNDPAAMRAYEEEKRAYEEDVKASIADTEKTLGADWRKRAFEKSRAEESKRAQEALSERAAVNRNLSRTGAVLPPKSALMKEAEDGEGMVEREGKEMVDLPEGGKASVDTIKRLYDIKAKQQAEKTAKEEAFGRNIEKRYAAAYEANKKRYEEELASRGFTPPKTREEENAYNAIRMEEFRLNRLARESADREEKVAVDKYRDYKRAAREARKNKDYQSAADFDVKAENVNRTVGGDITNVTARRRFLQDKENEKLKNELQGRYEKRRIALQIQTSANPEARDFRPKSTAAPIGVGTDSLSYEQRPQVRDATEQPFGLVPPTSEDRGVDFGSISPANVRGAEVVEESPAPVAPKDQPFRPPTSANQTEEDILPGISQMPPVPRDPNETPQEHNARVLEEYERSVILPSFGEDVQGAFLSAKQLNEQEKELFSIRFTSPENRAKYKEVAEKAKEQHDILKSEIDKLRKNSRNIKDFPFDSPQRKLNDQKIATLRKQLGFFAKRLY